HARPSLRPYTTLFRSGSRSRAASRCRLASCKCAPMLLANRRSSWLEKPPASMRREVARSLAALRPRSVSVMEVKVMTGSSVLFGVPAGAAAVGATPVVSRAGQGPALSGLGVVLEVPAADDDHGAVITAVGGAQTHRALDGHPRFGALVVDDAADHPRHRGQERAVLADDELAASRRDRELERGLHRVVPSSCSRSLSPSRIRPARS